MTSTARLAVLLLVLLLPAFAPELAGAGADDLDALLDGVETVAKPGIPGPLVVAGEEAFSVVLGRRSGNVLHAVVAAARQKRGRVVAFGHTGYLDRGSLTEGQTGRLVENAIRWAHGRRERPRVGTRGADSLTGWLREHGAEAATLDGPRWLERLSDVDVLVLGTHALAADEEIEAVQAFVRRGGGLLAAGLGWGWQQLNPQKDLVRDHPGNRLLGPFGLAWADGYTDEVLPVARPFDVARHEGVEAWHALRLVQAVGKPTGKPDAALLQAVETVAAAARALPPEDKVLWPTLRAFVAKAPDLRLPMPDAPLARTDVASRLAVILSSVEADGLPPEKIEAAAESAGFPGEVPRAAPRVGETVEIGLLRGGWEGTGLYAAPGEVVTVEIPRDAIGRRLAVRIGCHSDRLWDKDRWSRNPDVCRRWPLDATRTKVASPHGGLLYVEVPGGVEGTVAVRIRGAVRAPRFVLGQTDPAAWARTIRDAPAPWAELETSKIVLTVRADNVRALEDPTALMELWDRVLDACAELGQRPLRPRPERIVSDVQISAGALHSGYPIMGHLDAGQLVSDREALLEPGRGWGPFHELGHNFQQPEWTFDGTVEVTCNLFTLFITEKVTGIPPLEMMQRRKDRKKVEEHVAAGSPFDQWKSDPFLALWMYVEIQAAFGWEPFQKVFAEYRDLAAGERPKNDAEKRDQWLVRLSRTLGRDLGPYFQAWGVPTSDVARKQVEALPDWMPEGFPTPPPPK